MKTTIGIIGAGQIGQGLAKHLSKAGYPVLISNSRGADSLKDIAKEIGQNVTAVDPIAASQADVVVLSVKWAQLPEAVKSIRDWTNKIVIDTSNNILSTNPFTLAELNGKTTGEIVAGLIPGARVVKAFNTIGAQVVAANPVTSTGRRIIVMSGDDNDAKTIVSQIISSIGFHPVDLGSLTVGGKLQEVGYALSNIDIAKVNNDGQSSIETVRRNTIEVMDGGNFELFDQLFADDFIDHTAQPGFANDKKSVRELYATIRVAFPDFHSDIHWMTSDGEKVTTFKTYHGTHQGPIFGVEATGKKVQFETVDVMRVKDGKITDHWGVANLLSLMRQLQSL